jgi:predicted flap endonuclease-1-like 5' DNA nuclease
MPYLTAIFIASIATGVVAGLAIGWFFRGRRASDEKSAINKGWQEQLSAKDSEHSRLADQNKSLMTQISQFQASGKDAKLRAKELADALKEAFERRDRLQREIKDVRTSLDRSVAERDKLRSDAGNRAEQSEQIDSALAEKDAQIAKLRRELANWQNRVPPLIERFNERSAEVQRMETIVADTRARILELEAEADERSSSQPDPTQTRVEPVRNPDTLTGGRDASNEPIADRSPDSLNGSEVDSEEGSFNALRDNLKRIKGVGPAIEKTLNEMGIFRYNQIADMTEYDIDRVARRLKGLRTRIYREDWIGQARELHDAKTAS